MIDTLQPVIVLSNTSQYEHRPTCRLPENDSLAWLDEMQEISDESGRSFNCDNGS